MCAWYNTAHPETLYDSSNRRAIDQQTIGQKGLWEITQNTLVGAPTGKGLDADDMITLQNITVRVRWSGIDSSGLLQEPVAGSCEHGNKPSGLIK